MAGRKLSTWITAPLLLGVFAVLLICERRRPLRRSTEPKAKRMGRNAAIAAVAAAALQFTERPLIQRLTLTVETRRWGLLKALHLPMWAELPLALILLDYTLYVWHVLLHRVPWLWRIHLVHHVDVDLDASTAVRFHVAELLLSVPWRAAQVVLLGVSPLSLSVWQTLLLLSVMFHHSNVRLSLDTERRLNRLIVTPRMHGIHHSIVRDETDSNWSSGLTIWDRLHGTLKLSIPQEAITIGVPAYHAEQDVILPKLLRLPFIHQHPSWRFPSGSESLRRESAP